MSQIEERKPPHWSVARETIATPGYAAPLFFYI